MNPPPEKPAPRAPRSVTNKWAVLLPIICVLLTILFLDKSGIKLHPATPAELAEIRDLDHRAHLFYASGEVAKVEQTYREQLRLKARVFAPDSDEIMSTRDKLGYALLEQRKSAQAEVEFRAELRFHEGRIWRRQLSALVHLRFTKLRAFQNDSTHYSRLALATALAAQGKHLEAEVQHRAIIKRCTKSYGANNELTLIARYRLALCLSDANKLEEAQQCAQLMIADYRRTYGTNGARGPDFEDLYRILSRNK